MTSYIYILCFALIDPKWSPSSSRHSMNLKLEQGKPEEHRSDVNINIDEYESQIIIRL